MSHDGVLSCPRRQSKPDTFTVKMAKLFNNKQMIHIATEAVAFMGLAVYFSSKNKQLLEHIEGLGARLEDQETQIQNLTRRVQQLNDAMRVKILPELQTLSGALIRPNRVRANVNQNVQKRVKRKNVVRPVHTEPVVVQKKRLAPRTPKVILVEEDEEEEDEDEEEEDGGEDVYSPDVENDTDDECPGGVCLLPIPEEQTGISDLYDSDSEVDLDAELKSELEELEEDGG